VSHYRGKAILYGYLVPYFEQAVFTKKQISFQLSKALSKNDSPMPPELCKALKSRTGPIMRMGLSDIKVLNEEK
jgi:hypothetical protein